MCSIAAGESCTKTTSCPWQELLQAIAKLDAEERKDRRHWRTKNVAWQSGRWWKCETCIISCIEKFSKKGE